MLLMHPSGLLITSQWFTLVVHLIVSTHIAHHHLSTFLLFLFLLLQAVELHRAMINEMRGVPGVLPGRLTEGLTVKHCALSLVGIVI